MDEAQHGRNILVNSTQLRRLLSNLYTLTGIWAKMFDANGRDMDIRNDHSAFCAAINATAEGHARCTHCDICGAQECRSAGARGLYHYQCHAGLNVYLMPILEGGVPIAYLIFGQLLDDSASAEDHWQRVKGDLDWYNDDLEALHQKYLHLKQCPAKEISAYAEVLEALVSYIQLEGIIRSVEYTDLQKLEIYLDRHYMEPLSLQKISSDLHMGTTKLCALAKRVGDGKTVTQLISLRRVNAAKKLLVTTDNPISDVAETVGFSDYNYFTRIFKAATGMTPRSFRKTYTILPK